MINFIVQYWVQWLFGIIALGLAAVAKHYYGLYKKDKKHTEKDQLDQIHQDMDDKITESQQQMTQMINASQSQVMSQVIQMKTQSEQVSKDRYEYLAGLLTEHEQDAMESYSTMFNQLSSQMQHLQEESDAQDALIKEDLIIVHKGIDVLQSGVLSIQGREFKENCRALLRQDHVITETEYEEIVSDHDIYNSLGGNHRGDELFHMVQEKYKKNL